MTVLITGATGFVGRALCKALLKHGVGVRAALRKPHDVSAAADCEGVLVGEVGPDTQWTEALKDVEVVVHLAARVHVMHDRAADSHDQYRIVNALGTAKIAEEAAKAGVRRFVYMSTIKVNGEMTSGKPFTEMDRASPHDSYAASKWEAEQLLRAVSEKSNLEAVIIRPPLVYGPGVKGNMLKLLHCIYKGIPLPLASVANRRSLVGVDNLVDLIEACIYEKSAAGETFLAADAESISTPALIRSLARKCGKRVRLFPVPSGMMRIAASLLRKRGAVDRLCGSLVVDTRKANTLLGWTAPVSTEEGLGSMATWYMQEYGRIYG